MKAGEFTINEVSSLTVDTVIQDRPLIDAPQRKVETKSGYGTDGEIPFDEGSYDNTEMELLLLIDGTDMIESRQAFHHLIDTQGTYQNFTPYFDPDKIYRVMLTDTVQFENKHYFGQAQSAKVNLTVKPYKYLHPDDNEIMNGKTIVVDNPTYYVAEPLIILTGSGDVTLSVNGDEFTIRDMPEKIHINSGIYSTYTVGSLDIPLKSINDKVVTREYPLLRPGKNTISATGAVTRIEVEPRWRSLV